MRGVGIVLLEEEGEPPARWERVCRKVLPPSTPVRSATNVSAMTFTLTWGRNTTSSSSTDGMVNLFNWTATS
jgi:hypothetical protein